MKSKKAKEFIKNSINNIDKSYFIGTNTLIFSTIDLQQAVELAEEEMMKKAVDAHRLFCKTGEDGNNCDFSNGICNDICDYIKDFINLLNS